MTNDTDIVERLPIELRFAAVDVEGDEPSSRFAARLRSAADIIEKQRAEIEVLRGALEGLLSNLKNDTPITELGGAVHRASEALGATND